MNAQKITQTFNGLIPWQISGGYFKLLAAQYAVTVELFKDGQKVLLAQGAEAGFYMRIAFDRVEITTPVSEEISFLVSAGDGGSDRLVGDVSIVDGGRARTLANLAFMGYAGAGASVGNYTEAQLLNPAASGKVVTIKALWVRTGTAQPVSLYQHDTALANLNGYGVSKLIGGASSVAQLRYEAVAAALITGDALARFVTLASQLMEVVLQEPIVLQAGRGLVLVPGVVNADFLPTFEFLEDVA